MDVGGDSSAERFLGWPAVAGVFKSPGRKRLTWVWSGLSSKTTRAFDPSVLVPRAASMAEVDFEPAEDELLDEEAMDAEEGAPVSTDGKKKKGRGFREARSDGGRPNPGAFEALDASGGPGPLKCTPIERPFVHWRAVS